VKQPWYADDAGAGGKFDSYRRQLTKLQEIGPNYAYFPERSKSILIVPQQNFEAARTAFADSISRLPLVTAILALHWRKGRIEGLDSRKTIIGRKQSTRELASAAENYPQTAYSGLQKSLQQEW
jgi:hypothetical protein